MQSINLLNVLKFKLSFLFTNMFKVTVSFPKYVWFRCISKVAERSAAVESFKLDNDVNGMTVISIQPKVNTISKVAAVFNAGSRFEDYESRGMNHLLRRSVGLASGGYSAVNVTRHFQQMGSQLRCIGTRENLAYVVDFSYDLMDKVVELLAHATTRQEFYHWELVDSAKSLMNTDIQYIKRRDFNTLCSELLHKASFRDNLGNSLFADEYRIGSWNFDIIDKFLENNFTANKSMLVGVSVNHDRLMKLAQHFKIRTHKDLKIQKSVFRGGELRKELPLDYAISSIAWEAPGFNNMKDALAASILSYSIDSAVSLHIPGNFGNFDLVNKVVKDAKAHLCCKASSIYVSYSDSGLLGFTVTGNPKHLNEVIHNLHRHFIEIGKNGVSSQEFNTAKKAFIVQMLMKAESADNLMENVTSQSTGINKILSNDGLIEMANSVNIEDVNKIAKDTFSSTSKKAMAAVGDLSNVPFLDDLKC